MPDPIEASASMATSGWRQPVTLGRQLGPDGRGSPGPSATKSRPDPLPPAGLMDLPGCRLTPPHLLGDAESVAVTPLRHFDPGRGPSAPVQLVEEDVEWR